MEELIKQLEYAKKATKTCIEEETVLEERTYKRIV